MNYVIKAHPTRYNGIMFRSRLEARWAAFFDLHNEIVSMMKEPLAYRWLLTWKYEPIDFEGWTPDFYLSFHCGHSECPPIHELYIEVKPANNIEELRNMCSKQMKKIGPYSVPSPAMFESNPFVTEWEMVHGLGSAMEEITSWLACGQWPGEVEDLWREAGNEVQWRPS